MGKAQIISHRTGPLTFQTTTGDEVKGLDEFWANLIEVYLEDGAEVRVWSEGETMTAGIYF